MPELQSEFITEESRDRTKFYIQENNRRQVKNTFSKEQFLRQCNFKINIKQMQPYEVNRVTELIQRTNQLNTSIKRYSQSQIISLSHNANCDILTVYVSDKFGDYGLVGVCIALRQQNIYEIDTLLFSCRVMSKGIEDYALNSILKYAADKDFDEVILKFNKGPKNNQLRAVLKNNHFVESSENEDFIVYSFNLNQQHIKPPPNWFSQTQPDTETIQAISTQPIFI